MRMGILKHLIIYINLNYCIMYLWVAPVPAATCGLNRSFLVTKLTSTVDVSVLHLYWQNK